MKKFFLLCFVSLTFTCWTSPITLKENLFKAQPGSYVVLQIGKTCDFLYIREKTDKYLVLEEVAIASSNFQRSGLSWRSWFEQGAQGHTLWTISHINCETGHFEQTFSFTHNSWIDLSEESSFFSTLLNLPFDEQPLEKRKRIGLPPGRGKPDHRSYWMPKIFYEGHWLKEVACAAYFAKWPHDRSELSGRLVEIYIPTAQAACPTFFPYWIEVEGKVGQAKMRVIDSGLGVHSPRGSYPRYRMALLQDPYLTSTDLCFELSIPSTASSLLVMAIDDEALFPVPMTLPSKEIQELDHRKLLISADHLQQFLEEGKNYRFTVASTENDTHSFETGLWCYEHSSTIS